MDPETLDDFIKNYYGDAPDGLEDLSALTGLTFAVAVPADATATFKRYVMAAAQTQWLRNRSVDHVLKQYSGSWEFSDGEPELASLLSRICREVKTKTRRPLQRLHHFHKPAHAGLMASWAALFRLQATIRVCVFTIRQGFHFESACMLRLVVEQLAWVASIYDKSDLDAIFRIEPSKSLGTLRRLFDRAGFVYGYLSDKAHISPERTKDYVTSDEQGALTAMMNDREQSRLDALIFLVLADWYIVTCELVAANHREPDNEVLTRVKDAWRPNPERPFLTTISLFKARLFPKGDSTVE